MPHPTVDQEPEPESQPAHDPAADIEVTRKQRLRYAVKVANVLAQKVKAHKEVLRKKDFHLLLWTEQVKSIKGNPHGCPTQKQQKEAREKEMARQERLARQREKSEREAQRI